MMMEAKYLSWTRVSAHGPDAVVGRQGIMAGRASSSRLGSVAVPNISSCGNKRFITLPSSKLSSATAFLLVTVSTMCHPQQKYKHKFDHGEEQTHCRSRQYSGFPAWRTRFDFVSVRL